MAKTRKVCKIQDGLILDVIYTEGKTNPYAIYRYTWSVDQYGYPKQHRELLVRYADLRSCMYYIAANLA